MPLFWLLFPDCMWILRAKSAGVRNVRRIKKLALPRWGSGVECLEARVLLAFDFGDAPDLGSGTGPGDYQTTIIHDGPRHVIGGPRLGASVDSEPDAVTYLDGYVNKIDGFGDNRIGPDEDGVSFPSLLQTSPFNSTAGTVVVNVQNSNGTAKLDAWIDFNGDGDFGDAGEQIFVNLSVSEGNNNLSFEVPVGASSGKTFSRFRLSTSGNLAPTGVANDGEVEDSAVFIGGTTGLSVIENAILSHRYFDATTSTFALRSGNDYSFRQLDDNHLWYILDPYFSTFAVRALLAAPNTGSVDKFDVATDQLKFWLSHIKTISTLPSDRNVTIPRLIVDGNFTYLDRAVTGTDGAQVRTFDPATIGADADDSSFALLLSLAEELWSASRSDSETAVATASVLNSLRIPLERIGSTLLSLIQSNGLSNTFLQNNVFQYTLDNFEVLQALRQFSVLEGDFYLDSAKSAIYAKAATDLETAIHDELLDSDSKLYKWYADNPSRAAPKPDLNQWDPLVNDQIWPMITDAISGDSDQARDLLDKVYSAWNETHNIDWTTRTDAGALAWAALQAGDVARAQASTATILQWALQNSTPYPAPPANIANLGFLLQTLLPAANDDQATTTFQTPVTIDVRANDYSVSMPSSQLAIEITTAPELGNAIVVNGQIVYTPQAGFSGDETLVYQVLAADGGARTAKVKIHVGHLQINQPPNVTGNSTLTFVENAAAQPINSTLTVSDSDSATLSSAVVTLTEFLSGQDVLGFTPNAATMGNISSVGNINGVLSLSSAGATATLVQWQAALRSVTYRDLSDNPTTTQRIVSYQINDGIDSSLSLVSFVNITAINDAPTINQFSDVTINENSTTGALNLTLGDADTNPFGLSVSATFSSDTTLISTANIVFDGSGADRTVTLTPIANRFGRATITLRVSDGISSTDMTFRITVLAVDDPTVITLNSGTLTYHVLQRKAVIIDGTATVTDADNRQMMFSGSKLNVSGQFAKDTLSILNQGEIRRSGKKLLAGKAVIGTIASDKKGEPLTVTLTGSATLRLVQNLLRCVSFKSTVKERGNRELQFQITNISGASSNVATKQVHVVPSL